MPYVIKIHVTIVVSVSSEVLSLRDPLYQNIDCSSLWQFVLQNNANLLGPVKSPQAH